MTAHIDSPASSANSIDSTTVQANESKKYTCSVWAAFDKMQLCYTVLPQVKHYYRYGSWRDCSEAREEFNFCLRMKGKNRKEAERLIREREEAKYDKKINERPSRAVWELRTEPPPNFPPA
ncbi:hypothetical protein SpCBS45565_g01485 [Spizellomyces sp. 'palustris']|nr:hypothetical protein SpCBS45565_g01485 [Spizellomyces sp. 'palustris']